MTVSKEELARLRATAGTLQTEWRSIRSGGPQARLEVEEEQEAAQLRAEIQRLQADIRMEVKSVGGSSEDALEAMRRAHEAGEQAAAIHAEETERDPREENGTVGESETVTVNDGPPRNEEFLPFEEDITEVDDQEEGHVVLSDADLRPSPLSGTADKDEEGSR